MRIFIHEMPDGTIDQILESSHPPGPKVAEDEDELPLPLGFREVTDDPAPSEGWTGVAGRKRLSNGNIAPVEPITRGKSEVEVLTEKLKIAGVIT